MRSTLPIVARMFTFPPFFAPRLLMAAALALTLVPGFAPAKGLPDPAAMLQARLLPGWQLADGSRMAALSVRLAPEWKTYWRAPGEAGIPPEFDWSGSTNLRSVSVHWPQPEVFHLNGMQTMGYSGEMVLPLAVTAARPGAPVTLRADIDLGICREICVPVRLTLSADLGQGTTPDPVIARALADQPHSARAAGVTGLHCSLEPIADGLRLTARLTLPAARGGAEAAVVEIDDPGIWVSEAVLDRQGAGLTVTSDLVPATAAPFLLDRSGVRITLLGAGRAVELLGCPAD